MLDIHILLHTHTKSWATTPLQRWTYDHVNWHIPIVQMYMLSHLSSATWVERSVLSR